MGALVTRARGRRGRIALTIACAGVLATATVAATAVPVSASAPAKGGPTSTTTSSSSSSTPVKDDDAIKDPCPAVPSVDHSAENGSPKEQDPPSSCEPAAAPAPVVAVAAATVVPTETDLLACGETISTDGKGILPDVSITRLTDANQTGTVCDPFPYELKSIPDGLRFVKPSGYPLAQFFVDVTWYRTSDEVYDAPTVDFEAVDGGYPVRITDCPAQLRDPDTGEVVGATIEPGATPAEFAALGIVDQDGSPSVGNPVDNGLTQFACVADTNPVFEPWAPGGPRWAVNQRLFLLGDVIFRG